MSFPKRASLSKKRRSNNSNGDAGFRVERHFALEMLCVREDIADRNTRIKNGRGMEATETHVKTGSSGQ